MGTLVVTEKVGSNPDTMQLVARNNKRTGKSSFSFPVTWRFIFEIVRKAAEIQEARRLIRSNPNFEGRAYMARFVWEAAMTDRPWEDIATEFKIRG